LLAFVGGELQDLQIHLVGNLLAVMPREQVIGESKVAAREHLFAVPVTSERAGLSYQRIDHMTIVDAGGLLASESRHRLNHVPLVRHRDCLGADSHIDFSSDQATGYRVSVSANVDRRAFADADAFKLVIGIESNIGKSTKLQSFFGKPLLASRVGAVDDLLHEGHVLITTSEVATTTKQQGLVDPILDVSVL
jgi:hypothetical protein